jgi:hypothetical protein
VDIRDISTGIKRPEGEDNNSSPIIPEVGQQNECKFASFTLDISLERLLGPGNLNISILVVTRNIAVMLRNIAKLLVS